MNGLNDFIFLESEITLALQRSWIQILPFCSFSTNIFNQYLQLLLLQCTDTHDIFNLAKNQSLVCDKLTLHVHLCNFPCIWPKAGIKILSSADLLDTVQIFFIQGQCIWHHKTDTSHQWVRTHSSAIII